MEKRYRKVGRRYVEVEPQRFGDIDFFEFSFLVSACAGNRPIARSMFFDRVIDKYYHVLSQDERDNLFEWINRSSSFKFDLERGINEGFLAPYKPIELKSKLIKDAEAEGIDVSYVLEPQTREKIDLLTDKKLKIEQLNRIFISEENCNRIAEELKKKLEEAGGTVTLK